MITAEQFIDSLRREERGFGSDRYTAYLDFEGREWTYEDLRALRLDLDLSFETTVKTMFKTKVVKLKGKQFLASLTKDQEASVLAILEQRQVAEQERQREAARREAVQAAQAKEEAQAKAREAEKVEADRRSQLDQVIGAIVLDQHVVYLERPIRTCSMEQIVVRHDVGPLITFTQSVGQDEVKLAYQITTGLVRKGWPIVDKIYKGCDAITRVVGALLHHQANGDEFWKDLKLTQKTETYIPYKLKKLYLGGYQLLKLDGKEWKVATSADWWEFFVLLFSTSVESKVD